MWRRIENKQITKRQYGQVEMHPEAEQRTQLVLSFFSISVYSVILLVAMFMFWFLLLVRTTLDCYKYLDVCSLLAFVEFY